jgi:hypothetical protein
MANFEKIEFQFEEADGELVSLWFWDWAHGRDVCGTVMQDGTVHMNTHDEYGEENGIELISVVDFLKRIKESIDSRQRLFEI